MPPRIHTIQFSWPASNPLVLGKPDGRSVEARALHAGEGFRTGDRLWISGTGVERAILGGRFAPLAAFMAAPVVEPVFEEPPKAKRKRRTKAEMEQARMAAAVNYE